MSASRVRGLYAITPDEPDTALLAAMVDAALAGGAEVVQYRHKTASPALRMQQATALAGVCRRHARAFIVNDHLDIALAIPDAGLHVGADDADDLVALRARLGPERLLGVSCYADLMTARAAVAAGADYVAFGSVFPSTTKPSAKAAPLSLFRDARTLDVPLVGIGGIDATNLGRLVAAGADAAAIISALFESRDDDVIRANARTLASRFTQVQRST
jgi:thiamine-phosphate pyrophosphorylase